MSNQYRMPAEWEPQSSVWFIWPSNPEWWPGKLDKIQSQFVELLTLISKHTPINLLVANLGTLSTRLAKDMKGTQSTSSAKLEELAQNPKLTLHSYQTNDVWCRDCGPIFILGTPSSRWEKDAPTQKLLTDWQFTAWGDKFPDYDLDNGIPKFIADKLDLPRIERPTILEGGAIDVNGQGLCLTTEEVMLNANRGSYSKEFIEEELKLLGITEVIWLKRGLHNDDTDGHIDNLARFVNEDTTVMASTDDPKNPNFGRLKENKEILAQYPKLKVIDLPLPDPVIFEGEVLPASYLNFLITNDLVIVPTYNRPQDQLALNIIQELFPSHTVKGFNCLDIIEEGGAIHCLSQQEPYQ